MFCRGPLLFQLLGRFTLATDVVSIYSRSKSMISFCNVAQRLRKMPVRKTLPGDRIAADQ